MYQSLAHRTIVIVEGRSISSFRLCKALEDDGAAVCVTSIADAEMTLRQAQPDAVLIDFSLADGCEDLCAEMDHGDVTYMVCNSPNRHQDLGAQAIAAQDVAVALAERVNHREFGLARARGVGRDIDPELYAI
jgi:CheY-like chemotaxis protein